MGGMVEWAHGRHDVKCPWPLLNSGTCFNKPNGARKLRHSGFFYGAENLYSLWSRSF